MLKSTFFLFSYFSPYGQNIKKQQHCTLSRVLNVTWLAGEFYWKSAVVDFKKKSYSCSRFCQNTWKMFQNCFTLEIKTDLMWAFKSKGTEKVFSCPVKIKH